MERAGAAPPPPLEVYALIDTGASQSILQEDLIENLGVFPVGMVHMTTTLRQKVRCYEYLLDVELGDLRFGAVFIGAPLPNPDIQALLGRDVLAHGSFHYDGKAGRFTLEF
jgi:predicted aspartyl protease